MKTGKTVLLVGFIVLQLFDCAGFAGWVRQYTYPPTFHYITDQQLRSTMWRLAYHSRALRELMATPEELPDHRNEVLQHLRVMEQATIDLNRTGWPSNHALIDTNRTSFLTILNSRRKRSAWIRRIFCSSRQFLEPAPIVTPAANLMQLALRGTKFR